MAQRPEDAGARSRKPGAVRAGDGHKRGGWLWWLIGAVVCLAVAGILIAALSGGSKHHAPKSALAAAPATTTSDAPAATTAPASTSTPAAPASGCGTRPLTFAVHQNNGAVMSALVYLDGKRIEHLTSSPVTLVTLVHPPKGPFTLRIDALTADSKRVRSMHFFKAGCREGAPTTSVSHV